MATHGLWQSLPERVGKLEATIESLIRENERLRKQVANAHEAEEILRRAQGPPPGVPQPRNGHRRKRDKTVTYLRVIKVATIFALGVLVVAGAVIPASSIIAVPAQAENSEMTALQQRADAEEAGLCRGQLPVVGTLPGSDARVSRGLSPLGPVAYGRRTDRVMYIGCRVSGR